MKSKLIALFFVLFLLSNSSALAEECKGDFDYDLDVDGIDAFVFKSNFGRSQMTTPCPPAGPAKVQKTGQTACYDTAGNVIDCAGTGQDGEYQLGVEIPVGNTRFTDNGDGTVTDNLTGLIWLKNANCFGQKTWSEALSDCNGLAAPSCSLSDGSVAGEWRLPNIMELVTLIDFGSSTPGTSLQSDFDNVSSIFDYWSSTTNAIDPTFAWAGDTIWDKALTSVVWPVRNPE